MEPALVTEEASAIPIDCAPLFPSVLSPARKVRLACCSGPNDRFTSRAAPDKRPMARAGIEAGLLGIEHGRNTAR